MTAPLAIRSESRPSRLNGRAIAPTGGTFMAASATPFAIRSRGFASTIDAKSVPSSRSSHVSPGVRGSSSEIFVSAFFIPTWSVRAGEPARSSASEATRTSFTSNTP